MAEFKIICAWCGKVIGPCEDCEGDSHGICEKCHAKEMKKIEDAEKKKEKIWRPPAPF